MFFGVPVGVFDSNRHIDIKKDQPPALEEVFLGLLHSAIGVYSRKVYFQCLF